MSIIYTLLCIATLYGFVVTWLLYLKCRQVEVTYVCISRIRNELEQTLARSQSSKPLYEVRNKKGDV